MTDLHRASWNRPTSSTATTKWTKSTSQTSPTTCPWPTCWSPSPTCSSAWCGSSSGISKRTDHNDDDNVLLWQPQIKPSSHAGQPLDSNETWSRMRIASRVSATRSLLAGTSASPMKTLLNWRGAAYCTSSGSVLHLIRSLFFICLPVWLVKHLSFWPF